MRVAEKNAFRPSVEGLEGREVPAAGISFRGETVFVEGTAQADAVTVDQVSVRLSAWPAQRLLCVTSAGLSVLCG